MIENTYAKILTYTLKTVAKVDSHVDAFNVNRLQSAAHLLIFFYVFSATSSTCFILSADLFQPIALLGCAQYSNKNGPVISSNIFDQARAFSERTNKEKTARVYVSDSDTDSDSDIEKRKKVRIRRNSLLET